MANTLDITLDDVGHRRSSDIRGRGWGRGLPRGRGGMSRERASGMNRGGPLRAYVRPSPYKIAKVQIALDVDYGSGCIKKFSFSNSLPLLESFSKARDMIWRHDLFNDSFSAAGLTVSEKGTKLYISNLDYGVSNEDIKELFSEIGELRRSIVHYDRNGRPSGTAEVVFTRRSDALSALKRYNNVRLDGKDMKIEIVGDNSNLPISARINVVGRPNGADRRTVVMAPKLGQAGGSQFSRITRPNHGGAGYGGFQATRGRGGRFQANRGRGGGFQATRGCGGGFQATRGREGGFQTTRGRGGFRGGRGRRGSGRGRKPTADKSVDQLDKELDSYHAEAMNTS